MSILFLVMLLVVITYDFQYEFSSLIYLIFALIYLSFLIYGSMRIDSNFYLEIICRAQTNNKEIAITFDDGPEEVGTTKILDILDEFKVKAAFFMIGQKVKASKEIVKRIDASSHVIGGHSFSHSFFIDFFSTSKLIKEFKETEDLIFDITGKRINLFRPPYGVTNPTFKTAIKFMNYNCVGWSIRSYDTSIKETQKILARIKKIITPGSLILFHDTTENIEDILRGLLIYLNQNNYSVVRLDRLLSVDAYK